MGDLHWCLMKQAAEGHREKCLDQASWQVVSIELSDH